jgi:hypothetical protein
VKARISGQNSIVWYEGGGAASVFKTGALNRSATLPLHDINYLAWRFDVKMGK